MKKTIFVVIFFLIGCSGQATSVELVNYEKENIRDSINELTFNPEIPEFLPFEPNETSIVKSTFGGEKNNFISITFIDQNNDEVIYRAGKGPNAINFTDTDLTIQDNINADYGEGENFKTLRWEKIKFFTSFLYIVNPFQKRSY